MHRVDRYEYKVVDYFGTIYGFFDTKGLANQWLLQQFPSVGALHNTLDRQYIIKRVKRMKKWSR